jgi:hypothetical protein
MPEAIQDQSSGEGATQSSASAADLVVEEGKFRALRIELTLGASAYATMALREITREETSTWWQMGLTASGEDQGFKGSKAEAEGGAEEKEADGEGENEGGEA